MEGSLQAPHVAMLSTPGMGHLIPLAELAKRVVDLHGFTVTLITFAESSSKAQNSYLSSLPPSIASLSLPPAPLDDLPADAAIETRMAVACSRSIDAVRDMLRHLLSSRRLVAFVADLFAPDTFDAARDVGVPPYLYFPSNLQLLSLLLHLPALDASTTCEYRDLPKPLELPGCVPLPGADILQPLQDRSNDCYPWMVKIGKKYMEAEGILVNTFDAMEPGAAMAMKELKPPVYTCGPLIRSELEEKVDETGCLKWLDEQPKGTVVFVSFGSGGTLTRAQLCELAHGLEASGQRFIWVVRSPSDSDGDASAAYFTIQSAKDPFDYLPQGFVERTKGVGKVVQSWAPQAKILAHEATGGFLSHCGWNSTLESVVHGVPMIAWPLFAEQRMNAVMLVEGLKIAVRTEFRDDGLVGRQEVAKTVRELVEGEVGKKLRARSKELQEGAARALGDGGSSRKALCEVANRWKTTSTNVV